MRRGIPRGLKHLNRSGSWPSGNPRYYYRPKGGRNVPLPDLPPEDPAFLAAYLEAARSLPEAGTIAAAVVAFLSSDAYLARGEVTRRRWRHILDDVRRRYGTAMLRDLRPRHIRTDLAQFPPHPANARLKAWRALCRWAVDRGMIDTDPAREVRKPAIPASDGFRAWTREDVYSFRREWPIGTPQRLALEVLHWTGCRISDAVTLGWHNVEDGWIVYRQRKTGGDAVVPLADPPSWAEPDGMLVAALEHAAGETWLQTRLGTPRSAKAAAQWFSAVSPPGLSAHGLRKLRAQIMRENGATVDQRAAWLGHDSLSEVARYGRAADLKRVIGSNSGSNF